MAGLLSHGDSGHGLPEGLCAECQKRPAVGPCAACEILICGDCGVFSPDPEGLKVICLSCARLCADVSARRIERRPVSMRAIAIAVVIAFGALALALI